MIGDYLILFNKVIMNIKEIAAALKDYNNRHPQYKGFACVAICDDETGVLMTDENEVIRNTYFNSDESLLKVLSS